MKYLTGAYLVCTILMGCVTSASGSDECERLGSRVKDVINEVAVVNENPSQYEKFNGKQARLFRELENLGINAAPFVIKYMDDRRPLPFEYLALENKAANRFESMRQYSPRLVVDALAAVLNQLTGQNFGYIYNGATEPSRADSVKDWRRYLAEKFYEEYPSACR